MALPIEAGSAQAGPAGADIYLAEFMDVNGPALQQPGCGKGCAVSGDGTTSLWHMTWSTWTGATAVGTGTEMIDDCQPTCTGGHGYAVKVVVTFSHPVKDCARGGKWFWTQASFNWPNGLPTALSGPGTPTNPLYFAPIKSGATQSWHGGQPPGSACRRHSMPGQGRADARRPP